MRRLAWVLLASACSSSAAPSPSTTGEQAAVAGSGIPVALSAKDQRLTTPTPPPPPPPEPGPQPPPAVVLRYLDSQAKRVSPWTATVFELSDDAVKDLRLRFLGHRVVRKRSVASALATELADRLHLDASYQSGDIGCFGDPFGIRLERGGATFDFVVNCGHFLFSGWASDHEAVFSEEMIDFLQRLRH